MSHTAAKSFSSFFRVWLGCVGFSGGFFKLTLAHLCGLDRLRADGSVVIENGKEEDDDVDVVVVAMDDSSIEEALEEEVLESCPLLQKNSGK